MLALRHPKTICSMSANRMWSPCSRRLLKGGPTGRASFGPGVVGGGNYVAVTFGCNTKTASHARTPPIIFQLFSQAKTIDQVVVTIDVTTLQVLKKAAALADQLQQPA